MKIEFKKRKIETSEFCKFCEKNDADFFETVGEYGVWIIPKMYGSSLIGLRLNKSGHVDIVCVDKSCMNLSSISSNQSLFIEEQEWLIQTLTLLKKYKPEDK